MRSECNRTGLGRAIDEGDRRVRKTGLDVVEQLLRGRRRAHAHVLDGGEIEAGKRLALPDHQRQHGRHTREPRAVEPSHGFDIASRLEARQQHERRPRREREFRPAQAVHVEQGRRNQEPLAGERAGTHAVPDGPKLAIVGKGHTLRAARRARGIEHHGRLARLRSHRFEGAAIQQRLEAVRPRVIEADAVHAGWERSATFGVVEGERDAGVAHDVGDGVPREAEVHRHGDQPGPHRAQVGDQELGAIGGKDGNGAAARQALPQEAARAGIGKRIDARVSIALGLVPVAAVDQRQAIADSRHVGQIAQIERRPHCRSRSDRRLGAHPLKIAGRAQAHPSRTPCNVAERGDSRCRAGRRSGRGGCIGRNSAAFRNPVR